MVSTAKPYERFGSFLLFKKIESDAVSELWRAAEILGDKIGPYVALRRFTGGDRDALRSAAEHARAVVGSLTGTTVVRGQKVDFINDIPYLVHEYSGGRTLKTIVDRARGTAASPPNPIPVDQSLAIVEKLASSCEILSNIRYQGARLVHGSLIPQFVWISEEGEVRAAGHQFGKGILASLANRDIARELGSFFAPELKKSGEPTKASDVYALGSLLYLMLTEKDLGEIDDTASLAQTLDVALLANRNEKIPADIRPILEKSLDPDPARRYPGAAEMRQAVDKLLNGSEYAPTTFNLAFYLHSLLRKDMEIENHEHIREEAVNLAPYLAQPEPPPRVVAAAPVVAAPIAAAQSAASPISNAPFSSMLAEEPKKSRLPLIIAAVVVILGGATWFALSSRNKAPVVAAVAVQKTTTTPATKPIEPISALPPGANTTAALDPEARKKLIEEAVNGKVQAEMMRLQEEYNKQLQKQQAMKPSQPTSAPAPAPASSAREDGAPSAAQLDQQHRTQPQPAAAEAPAQTASSAPVEAAPPPAAVAQSTVRDGDTVAVNDLDSIPELRSPVRPVYPPIAAKRRMEATVIVSVLISETGRVSDVRVLRGDGSHVGFDEAALRAVRAASFTVPMKDGKRVRTWKPLPVFFRLQ